MTFAGAERSATVACESRKFDQPVFLRLAGELRVFAGEIAVIHRLHFAPVVLHHVTALQNPIAAQRRQTFLGRAGERRIAPRPAAIVNMHRRIFPDRAGVRLGRRHFDFAHGHADAGMDFARHKNFFAVGQLFAAVRFERFFGRDHKSVDSRWLRVESGSRLIWEMLLRLGPGGRHAVPSYASITWIRFLGLRRSAPNSQPSSSPWTAGWLPEH